MDAEERRYAAQRDGVRYAQATDAWLNDALATLLQGAVPRATQALEAVLDFQPAPRCYGVSNSGGTGEGEGDADVYRMVDSLTRCEVHPAGWMLFEKDYLAPSDAANINKRSIAEAEASDASNTFGSNGSAFSGGASFSELGSSGGGSAAASERARRIATAQRQAADSRASIAIRRAVLPVCLMLLHEVHHATAVWLLEAAKTSAAASAYAGSGGSSGGGGQVEGLQRLAATEFRRALQVADLAAARQHALYACLDGDALRKLLAACHASSMELLDLTGGLEME